MQTDWLSAVLKCRAAVLLFVMAGCGSALSQQVSFAMLRSEAMEPAPVVNAVSPAELPEAPRHKFWDRENRVLFAAVAASSTADFAVTYSNLQNGGIELNPVTRVFSGSTAGLAVNFAGETAGVIGISYLFHKTGHHKLERLVSMTNIGASGAAVAYGLTHR
jgi:hypothetical protein